MAAAVLARKHESGAVCANSAPTSFPSRPLRSARRLVVLSSGGRLPLPLGILGHEGSIVMIGSALSARPPKLAQSPQTSPLDQTTGDTTCGKGKAQESYLYPSIS